MFVKSEKKTVLSCSKCGFVFWNTPKPVVSALLIYSRRVLLVQRNKGAYKFYWALPGGVIDFLETPEHALKREVKEETGFNVSLSQLIDSYLIVYAPRGLTKKPSHTSIDLVYRISVSNRLDRSLKSPDGKEIRDIKFFPLGNLPKKIAFGHREIVKKHKQLV